MNKYRPCVSQPSTPKLIDEGTLQSSRRSVVRRRSFLHGIGLGAIAATLPVTSLFASEKLDSDRDNRPLTGGDVAILRLAAAVDSSRLIFGSSTTNSEAR